MASRQHKIITEVFYSQLQIKAAAFQGNRRCLRLTLHVEFTLKTLNLHLFNLNIFYKKTICETEMRLER
jgi:hypothetical protein